MGLSARLVRAVTAERTTLERQRAHLAREADTLRAALARIEAGMAEIDELCARLDHVAPAGVEEGDAAGASGAAGTSRADGTSGAAGTGGAASAARGAGAGAATAGAATAGAATAGPATAGPEARVLRGPEIRAVAVAVLVARGHSALHYRDWFDLVTREGYAVAGKDPLAVFLTQLSRSPALRKGAQPGHYELDREAEARHRAQLDDLHAQLRELTTDTDLTAIRARRTHLTAEISKTEKALEEIRKVTTPQRDAA